MKWKYKLLLIILLVGAVALIFLSYFSALGCDSQAARLIQILTGLAIAVTAVIALSATDPKRRKIVAEIKPYIAPGTQTKKETSEKKDMNKELKEFYKNFNDPITSCRVQFRITNISKFDWEKPVITFRLPSDRQTPHTEEKKIIIQCHNGQLKPVPLDEGHQKYTIHSYHSNAFNPLAGGRLLEMVDGVIMSTTNLPHWPKDWPMTIWIRMALDNKGTLSKEFKVPISVDCENADGFAKTLELDPKELLKDKQENGLSSEAGD